MGHTNAKFAIYNREAGWTQNPTNPSICRIWELLDITLFTDLNYLIFMLEEMPRNYISKPFGLIPPLLPSLAKNLSIAKKGRVVFLLRNDDSWTTQLTLLVPLLYGSLLLPQKNLGQASQKFCTKHNKKRTLMHSSKHNRTYRNVG